MGGWEEDDNPFVEHLRLSPHCGWAIVAGIETGLGDYALDDPTGNEMINARKATFGDRWPHDGKRGWKCKTKQVRPSIAYCLAFSIAPNLIIVVARGCRLEIYTHFGLR